MLAPKIVTAMALFAPKIATATIATSKVGSTIPVATMTAEPLTAAANAETSITVSTLNSET